MPGWNVAVRHRVIVNLVTGRAINGVLLKKSGPILLLGDCQVQDDQGGWVAVDGQVVVERSRVEFVQALGG